MAIDGLIILDTNGRPIIQSGFRSTNTAYALLHIDTFNNALAKAARPSDVNPLLFLPSHDAGDALSACCHVPCGDVRILCPISGDVDPLLGFSFLKTFVGVLKEYFGSVSAATLRDNFDVVYQLLEEMLDSSGHPVTTFSNALRDIVLPPSLFSKLLSAANITASLNTSMGAGASVFASPIPWRRANVKHTSNEIYFDVTEGMVAVVNKHGTMLSNNVWGKIECNSRLSGIPDLLVTFQNPSVLADCSFHPCVRLSRWTSNKSLSFVPPDGNFVLMEYRYSPAARNISNQSTLAVTKDIHAVPVPFVISGVLEFEENSVTLDLSLKTRLSGKVTSLEDLAVELYLGDDPEISALRCDVGRGSSGFGSTEDGGEEGIAGWSYDPKRRVLRWKIGSTSNACTHTLKGFWNTALGVTPRPARAVQVTFSVPLSTFSALKIDQLKVAVAEGYKPYKGVRGRGTGKVEWRI